MNGKLTVEVRRPGGETVMSDIIHLVEEAQTRAAPVQRLADKVYTNLHMLIPLLQKLVVYTYDVQSSLVPLSC